MDSNTFAITGSSNPVKVELFNRGARAFGCTIMHLKSKFTNGFYSCAMAGRWIVKDPSSKASQKFSYLRVLFRSELYV